MLHLPTFTTLLQYAVNKIHCATYQLSIEKKWKRLMFHRDVMKRLQTELTQNLTREYVLPTLTEEENEVVRHIRQQTKVHNRNNVTRTEAYRRVYLHTPELHWALLAHMVSRNGGWNMTDLKGELLSRLLTEEQCQDLFKFLERCNGLIFQDAYPQLLLYQESKKRRQNLLHLLPAFHVSRFMLPFWNEFWQGGDSALLSVGLIINEQSYIEKRAIQHRMYAEQVYNTLHFRLQSLLHLTQVAFPFYSHNFNNHRGWASSGMPTAAQPRLAGVIAESFPQLDERIGVGKALYSILFGIPEVTDGVLQFVKETPHTGSRADYWSHMFTAERTCDNQRTDRLRASGRLQADQGRLYSPRLDVCWPDVTFITPERGDWFTNVKILDYTAPLHVPIWFDMTEKYRDGLRRLTTAATVAQRLNVSAGE